MQCLAQKHGVELEIKFPQESTQDDIWVEDYEDEEAMDFEEELHDDIIKQIKWDIKVSIDAEKMLCCFQTLLLCTMHPDPPSNAMSDSRDESTFFVQGNDNVHPTAEDARTVMGHNGPLLNVTERHVHQQYCQNGAKKQSQNGTNAAAADSNNTGNGQASTVSS